MNLYLRMVFWYPSLADIEALAIILNVNQHGGKGIMDSSSLVD